MILGWENDFSWIHYKSSANFKIEIKVKKRDELNRKKNTNDNQQNVTIVFLKNNEKGEKIHTFKKKNIK